MSRFRVPAISLETPILRNVEGDGGGARIPRRICLALSSGNQGYILPMQPVEGARSTESVHGRDLLSADRSEADLPPSDGVDGGADDKDGKNENDDASSSSSGRSLSTAEAAEFCTWFQTTLSSKVSKCKTTNRLSSSPAVVTDNESGALRRMMRIVETQEGGGDTGGMPLPKQTVEINPNHEIIVGMNILRDTDPVLAQVLAEQILDNCLVAAGLLDDGRSMLPRLNDLMLCVVKSSVDTIQGSEEKVHD